MRFEQPQPSVSDETIASQETPTLRLWVGRTLRELAVHDWLVVGYCVSLVFAASQGDGPGYERSVTRTVALLAFLVASLFIVRGGLLRDRVAAPLLYRVAVYGSVQLSYFLLRDVLPTAAPGALDEQLYRLDIRLFGVEPTLFADRFVSSATTEWFSFFYFDYFLLLAVHVLPFLFLTRRGKLFFEFAFALLLVFCTAHLLYMVVPGYGPYKHLAGMYQHELPHGTWYDLVLKAVSSAGAQKDIFPSLHTAGPTTLAIFSFRHRDKFPFKYTWPVVTFFAVNIIGATIFLRWHYLIDVVAGIALAFTGVMVAAKVGVWEDRHRKVRGLSSRWPALFRPWIDEEPSASPRSSSPSV
jgi:membrane-associated phospholipid phosphatase